MVGARFPIPTKFSQSDLEIVPRSWCTREIGHNSDNTNPLCSFFASTSTSTSTMFRATLIALALGGANASFFTNETKSQK